MENAPKEPKEKNDFKDIKEEIWKEYARQEKWIDRHIKLFYLILVLFIGGSIYGLFQIKDYVEKEVRRRTDAAVEEELTKTRKSISDRIDKEFETPRIQALIESSAKKYTEGRVDNYISQKVDLAITPYSKKMTKLFEGAKSDTNFIKMLVLRQKLLTDVQGFFGPAVTKEGTLIWSAPKTSNTEEILANIDEIISNYKVNFSRNKLIDYLKREECFNQKIMADIDNIEDFFKHK